MVDKSRLEQVCPPVIPFLPVSIHHCFLLIFISLLVLPLLIERRVATFNTVELLRIHREALDRKTPSQRHSFKYQPEIPVKNRMRNVPGSHITDRSHWNVTPCSSDKRYHISKEQAEYILKVDVV
jgi:hypothetical protein